MAEKEIRDVHTRTFVVGNYVELTGADLAELATQIVRALCVPGAEVGDGVIRTTEGDLSVSPAQADGLRQYVEAAPGETPAEREMQYLMRLCIDPTLRQWHQQYVTLSGGYREAYEFERGYSELLVRGDGPERRVERVALADIREALDKHRTFILKAPPGGGKTTVLQRVALEKALARLRTPEESLLPLMVRLAAQKPTEDPHEFLARMWRMRMPGAADMTDTTYLTALKEGQLCLLCDALNEAQRERYEQRMREWGPLPGSCRPATS